MIRKIKKTRQLRLTHLFAKYKPHTNFPIYGICHYLYYHMYKDTLLGTFNRGVVTVLQGH